MQKFGIALVQIDTTADVKTNLDKIEALVSKASKKAELVILPEHADGIGERDSDFEHTIPSEITDFYSSLARQNSVFLHCGSVAEKGNDQKPFNTSILFNPNGEIIAKYSKLHLFDVDLPDGTGCRESNGASAGNEIIVADTPLAKLGLSICYDLRFPELYRKMALMGAELMIVSANFTAQTGEKHWKPLLQARAIENGCYVAGINQCGKKPQYTAWGHTMLINPMGEIICELEQDEGIAFGEIDPAEIESTRANIPSLSNRRDDLY